ncbi:hypothetical protein D9M71_343970 [compost metagenome]
MILEPDVLAAVQAHAAQQFFDQRQAVARPHAQRIPCFVNEARILEVEDDLPGFLYRPGAVEQAVMQQPRFPWALPAVEVAGALVDSARLGSGFQNRRTNQRRADRAQPLLGQLLVLRLAIHPLDQALRAELHQALIELAAKTAELIVTGVAQRQNGKAQPFAPRGSVTLQGLPQRRAIVRGITIAEGTGDQQDAGSTAQLIQRHFIHAAQLYILLGFAQALGAEAGQGFGIAGLRGPQHQMPLRHRGHSTGSAHRRA